MPPQPGSGECHFCKTPDPRVVVYHDDDTFALIDNAPINPYHTLVIPRADHLSDDDVAGKGFNLVAHFKVHLIPRYANDGVRIAWNRPQPPARARREQYADELRKALRSQSG